MEIVNTTKFAIGCLLVVVGDRGADPRATAAAASTRPARPAVLMLAAAALFVAIGLGKLNR